MASAILPFVPSIISGGSAIASALLGRGNPKETGMQKKQRELVDQLLASLNGTGPYSDLFQADEAGFQKSFVEPAMSRFRNQTAPQIQQSYISGGQQRSTGLEDTLARAGVDMDQLLNEHYLNYTQQAQNRKSGALNAILGAPAGIPDKQSIGSALQEGAAGFLSNYPGTKQGSLDIENILNYFKGNNAGNSNIERPLSKGFTS